MSKMVYLDTNSAGQKYVREIIPDEARPIEYWYNAEFASHCVEAPDDISQNMFYNERTKTFSELPDNESISSSPEDIDTLMNELLRGF